MTPSVGCQVCPAIVSCCLSLYHLRQGVAPTGHLFSVADEDITMNLSTQQVGPADHSDWLDDTLSIIIIDDTSSPGGVLANASGYDETSMPRRWRR